MFGTGFAGKNVMVMFVSELLGDADMFGMIFAGPYIWIMLIQNL